METEQLIDLFFLMERECDLFNEQLMDRMPIWDVLRLPIFFKYYYKKEDLKKLHSYPRHNLSYYIVYFKRLMLSPMYLFFRKGENIILACSRSKNSDGLYFDKSSDAIIKELGDNCFIVESQFDKKIVYKTFNNFVSLFRIFMKVEDLPNDYYDKICELLQKYLVENKTSYSELNKIYHAVQVDYAYYRLLFMIKKTRRVFVAIGEQKGIYIASKSLGITTYEIQHGSITRDNILYSYPEIINNNSNIAFPDYLLTFSDYWGTKVNVPAKKVISIGNDYMCFIPNVPFDNSILIVSTIIHGRELSELTIQLAKIHPSISFIFKLHNNEFKRYKYYNELFQHLKNVLIVRDESDLNILISKSQLVIIIVSTVLYEALNQNKKVAIYKKLNYEVQKDLFDFPNVYLFDDVREIKAIIAFPVKENKTNFFKPLDLSSSRLFEL